jgi:dTMP kinase
MNRLVTGGLVPDLTLVFDLPVSQGLARRRAHAGEQNRLDGETRSFHARVRRGFLDLAAKNPRRITVIDARRSPDGVEAHVGDRIQTFLQAPLFRNRVRSSWERLT